MEISEIKKLRVGTPIKVIYRKFPYIGRYHCTELDGSLWYVYVRFAGEYVRVKPSYIFAIDKLTVFK